MVILPCTSHEGPWNILVMEKSGLNFSDYICLLTLQFKSVCSFMFRLGLPTRTQYIGLTKTNKNKVMLLLGFILSSRSLCKPHYESVQVFRAFGGCVHAN